MARHATPLRSSFEFDAFLCHHSDDKPTAERLAARLGEAGLRPFLDKWHLIPGDPWQEALERAIANSRCCAVLLGPAGMGPWQHEEKRAALQKRVSDPNFRVVPVLLPGASLETRSALPSFLRRLTWVDLTLGLDSEGGFASLVSGINGTAPGRVSSPTDEGRTSWEHYDWLLQIDDYQIAYIPLISAEFGDRKDLHRSDILLSAEGLRFELPNEFLSTQIRPNFVNDRSCRLSSYDFTTDKKLSLRFSETSYADYLKSGEHLDDPHPFNSSITLRDAFGGLIREGERNLRPFRLTNICGIGLFVISSDGFAIATWHSQKSHVYPGRLTFTASGTMKWAAQPDPFSQVVRKAWEETRHQVVLDSLAIIDFGVDARKLYFQFSFKEDHPARCDEILSRMNGNPHIKAIPLEPDAVVETLLTECWEPAAEAALLTLVIQKHCKNDVVHALQKRRDQWAHRNMRDEWDYRASRPGVLADMSVRYPPDKLNVGSRRYVDAVLEFLKNDLKRGANVVEVGGGTGRITRKLVDRVEKLTVVDLSSRMIDRNKRRLGKKANIVAEYVEDFAQECLDKRSFDVAIASLVMVHNVERKEFVGLVESMCKAAPVVVICEDVTLNRPTSPRTTIRTSEEIRAAFRNFDFELTKQRRFSLFGDDLWLARFSRVDDGGKADGRPLRGS